MNAEFQPLADDLYRRRLARARALSPEERMKAGPELFDYACAITLTALAEQLPGASQAELLAVLRRRLAVKKRLEAQPQ